MDDASSIRVGLIGAGRIGSSHAETIARRVPAATLVAVADPRPGVAEALAAPLGARGVTDPCSDHERYTVVGPSERDLATALSRQSFFEGSSPAES